MHLGEHGDESREDSQDNYTLDALALVSDARNMGACGRGAVLPRTTELWITIRRNPSDSAGFRRI